MRIVLAVVLSYLLGGILFGELIALIFRVDVRKKGSGNPGATNVYRILGPLFGLIVLVGDTLKGVIGCLLGGWLGVPEIAPWCALAVIAGHNWPLQFKFKGGKGIATSFGTIIVLAPATLLVITPLWIITLLLSGYVSLSSIVAALGLPLSCLVLYPGNTDLFFYAVLACLLAISRHRANIQRIMNGTENKILRKKAKEDS
ncbi:MAG TPA: glycerol-3-phosphate 1-O-acyltransferase PlsY [Firmicutes bacterium]|uniref:Glycerol-3-phosphate acyltransferase n=1 Tax=Capillibacterium thermochitinicola TaxID=2699427 RepID=A0A8J6I1K8_9FIRM|nr:glycerol-3-phosphate 1-O-acyltransferase PlsY [Capillibacterium thermochitinicola]MBA2133588.1 glycerol-3-phosphate 1-O-acyltransferase PlsY [Capillibacterium thermochitinicola]HHW12361.1 glycerol-3-phosphate 1-O-acyltransferase PlsY [Bacillota bacterium]